MLKFPYLRRGLLAAALLAGLTVPAERGHAQSLNLGSSMGAYCVGANCSTVTFVLELAGDAYVDLVRIFSHDATQWVFSGLLGVMDRFGNPLAWTGTLGNSNLLLRGSGAFGAEPIFLTVGFSTWGSTAQLYNGSLTYSGQGNTQIDGLGSDISYGGTVTPEPASMALLATGLFGIAGAARRRRRREADPSPA